MHNKQRRQLTGSWLPIGTNIYPTTWHAKTNSGLNFQSSAMNICLEINDDNLLENLG